MKIPTITQSIIKSNKIRFFDENDIEIFLSNKSNVRRNYIGLNFPSFTIDVFATKTKSPEKIISITIEDLRKLGYILTSKPSGKKSWFIAQRKIYCIEKIQEKSMYSKKLNIIPLDHKIERDINNNTLRLVGKNAGYPHKGNGGNLIKYD